MTHMPHFDTTADTMIELAIRAINASTELQLWRADAGAKSSWNNHVRLREGGLFQATEAAFADLTSFLQTRLPAHWGMADWAFKPARMGGEARWGSKGGRAQDGKTLSASRLELLPYLGFWHGLIEGSRRKVRSEVAILKCLGLDPSASNTFSVKTYTCLREISGHTPTDAISALAVKTYLPGPTRSLPGTPPEECFAYGLKRAKDLHERLPLWSAAPTLWPLLRKDKRVRRLCGAAPKMRAHRPLWAEHDLAAYDRTLAAAIALCQSIDAPKSQPVPFLLKESNWTYGTSGWCGSSAILQRIVSQLDDGKLPSGIESWEVFALADECGTAARAITSPYAPPNTEEDAS